MGVVMRMVHGTMVWRDNIRGRFSGCERVWGIMLLYCAQKPETSKPAPTPKTKNTSTQSRSKTKTKSMGRLMRV